MPKLSAQVGQALTKDVYSFEDQQRQKKIALSSFGWWKKTPTEACYFFGTLAKAEKSRDACPHASLSFITIIPIRGDTHRGIYYLLRTRTKAEA